MSEYAQGFMHGWLLTLVLYMAWAYFDTRRWNRKQAELRKRQDAIDRRIDELAKG